MITKADLDAPWMDKGARIIGAALAEVGVRVSPPPPGGSVSVSASVPIDLRYRALALAHLATGRPVMHPADFPRHLHKLHPRGGEPTPTLEEQASMQRFYDRHGGAA